MSFFYLVFNLIFFVIFIDCKSLPKKPTNIHSLVLHEGEVYRQQLHLLELAYFNYLTNLTNENVQKKITTEIAFEKVEQQVLSNLNQICSDTTIEEPICNYNLSESELLPDKEMQRLKTAIGDIEEYYVTGYLEDQDLTDSTEENSTEIPITGEDVEEDEEDDEKTIYTADEMIELWENDLIKVGPKVRENFLTYVELSNKAAHLNNYTSHAEYWIDAYADPDFEDNIENAVKAIMPLYRQLHGYIRHCLKKYYNENYMTKQRDIPVHLLDGYFGASWEDAHDLCMPHNNKFSNFELNQKLEERGYSGKEMTVLANEFYQSLGMRKLPESFWNLSIFSQRNDTPMDCQPMAFDMYQDSDVRISMCPEGGLVDIFTIVHELGHIQFFLQYENQFPLLRAAANPGFDEAVGETIILSFKNFKHLRRIGLLNDSDHEIQLNLLYSMAMDKIAYIPYAFSLEKYRYGIFRGEINESEWNTEYWRMRSMYSGISPPIQRTEDDFDPPNIEHFRTDSEVMCYVAAHIFQFQFHKALCKIAKQYDPKDKEKSLDKCDIYGSKAAGKAFSKFLSLGASKYWKDALEEFTGERKMNASALLEYFKPLYDWLLKYNKKNNVYIGWPTEGDWEKVSGLEKEDKINV